MYVISDWNTLPKCPDGASHYNSDERDILPFDIHNTIIEIRIRVTDESVFSSSTFKPHIELSTSLFYETQQHGAEVSFFYNYNLIDESYVWLASNRKESCNAAESSVIKTFQSGDITVDFTSDHLVTVKTGEGHEVDSDFSKCNVYEEFKNNLDNFKYFDVCYLPFRTSVPSEIILEYRKKGFYIYHLTIYNAYY